MLLKPTDSDIRPTSIWLNIDPQKLLVKLKGFKGYIEGMNSKSSQLF